MAQKYARFRWTGILTSQIPTNELLPTDGTLMNEILNLTWRNPRHLAHPFHASVRGMSGEEEQLSQRPQRREGVDVSYLYSSPTRQALAQNNFSIVFNHLLRFDKSNYNSRHEKIPICSSLSAVIGFCDCADQEP
jgi:hypothetical protein